MLASADAKVMCDLFCIQDSVRQGTSAVLESLKGSHDVLMQNIQALLDYQTKYILWAINQEASRKPMHPTPRKERGDKVK